MAQLFVDSGYCFYYIGLTVQPIFSEHNHVYSRAFCQDLTTKRRLRLEPKLCLYLRWYRVHSHLCELKLRNLSFSFHLFNQPKGSRLEDVSPTLPAARGSSPPGRQCSPRPILGDFEMSGERLDAIPTVITDQDWGEGGLLHLQVTSADYHCSRHKLRQCCLRPIIGSCLLTTAHY